MTSIVSQIVAVLVNRELRDESVHYISNVIGKNNTAANKMSLFEAASEEIPDLRIVFVYTENS